MRPFTDLRQIFRSAVVLVVEDQLTRQYLQRLLFVGPISIYVAGSAEGVRALVDAARADNLLHVYGVVDQDYGQSNFLKWREIGYDVKWFILPVHEVENLLLDESALENAPSNNSERTAFMIGERLLQRAKQLTWTAALRQVLHSLRGSLVDDFPKHRTFDTLVAAHEYITQSPWFRTLSTSARWIGNEAEISVMLAAEQAKTMSSLSSGAWRHTFPGKELFRIARSYVFEPPMPSTGVRPSTPSDLDVTLAQEIAEWQVANSAVPKCMTELRDVLRLRNGV